MTNIIFIEYRDSDVSRQDIDPYKERGERERDVNICG